MSRPTNRELELWSAEWTRPQAVVWEARNEQFEVALFVRAAVVSERPKASAADRALVLRFLEDLGISQSGLARNRWRIGEQAVSRQRSSPAEVVSVRDRLRVVGA